MTKEQLIKLLLQIARDCGLLEVFTTKFVPAVIQALLTQPELLGQVLGLFKTLPAEVTREVPAMALALQMENTRAARPATRRTLRPLRRALKRGK